MVRKILDLGTGNIFCLEDYEILKDGMVFKPENRLLPLFDNVNMTIARGNASTLGKYGRKIAFKVFVFVPMRIRGLPTMAECLSAV
ncbi:hypothetical protein ACLOJK_029812 [Asimina triloba]